MNNKLKNFALTENKRTLFRLQNLWGTSYFSNLKKDNKTYECDVIDINSTSIALKYANIEIENIETFDTISIFFGKKEVATITHPMIKRIDKNQKLIAIEFYNPEKREGIRDALRLKIQSKFTPQVKGSDPLRPYEKIFFSVEDLNKDGMKLSTSMRNKHLLPNMTLKKFTISLPNDQDYLVDFEIMHIRQIDDKLILGTKFLNIGLQFKEALSRYALFGAVPQTASPLETIEIMRQAKFSLRRISEAIKVTEVHTPAELIEALNVRLEAYQAASKLEKNITLDTVYDKYDDYSIVFAGRINNKIIATFRITETQDITTPLPFESYFDFKKYIRLERSEVAEVSRLGVLTAFQGSDIILSLFRTVNREIAKSKKAMIILSTNLLKNIYKDLGAEEISESIPHPTIPNENLTLLMLHKDSYLFGTKILEKNWFKVVQENFTHLYEYGYIEKSDIKKHFKKLKELFRKNK